MYDPTLHMNRFKAVGSDPALATWTEISSEYLNLFAFERGKWRVGILTNGLVTVAETRRNGTATIRDHTRDGLRRSIPSDYPWRLMVWNTISRAAYPLFVRAAVGALLDEMERVIGSESGSEIL